jgi:hypothetical protein
MVKKLIKNEDLLRIRLILFNRKTFIHDRILSLLFSYFFFFWLFRFSGKNQECISTGDCFQKYWELFFIEVGCKIGAHSDLPFVAILFLQVVLNVSKSLLVRKAVLNWKSDEIKDLKSLLVVDVGFIYRDFGLLSNHFDVAAINKLG